jgi:hypothetical protein
MKISNKLLAAVGGITLLLSGTAVTEAAETWQQTLQKNFDVAETFDDVQDWDGFSLTGYNYGSTNAPKKSDGSATRWVYFTNDRVTVEYAAPTGVFAVADTVTGATSGARGTVEKLVTDNGKTYLQFSALTGKFSPGETISNQNAVQARFVALPKWIANHGSDYVFKGNGKSLRINYYDFSGGVAGFGPSRLGTFLGDGTTGKSGYKKAYLFMMVKFQPGFFKQNADGTFQSVGTLKFFEMLSGFTAVDYWGTAAEHATSDGTPQVNTEYGLNFTVFNLYGGGASTANRLFVNEYSFISNYPTTLHYVGAPYIGTGRPLSNGTTANTDFTSFYKAGEWFGLEVAMDLGTPNTDTGTIDFWIYDAKGNEKGHFSATGERRLNTFDHFYNKITLGGNRLCLGYGQCPAGQDNRWYVDDVIINKDRIGPKYFSLFTKPSGTVRGSITP